MYVSLGYLYFFTKIYSTEMIDQHVTQVSIILHYTWQGQVVNKVS